MGNGTIKVSFSLMSTEPFDEIGASKIVVEKKIGQKWTPMKTYDKTKYPELVAENNYLYATSIQYSGEPGSYYRAIITIFAGPDSRIIYKESVEA